MIPQVGDQVAVSHLGTAPDGVIDAITEYGALGVELDGAGRLTAIVLETDGGATFIPKSMVLSIRKEDPS